MRCLILLLFVTLAYSGVLYVVMLDDNIYQYDVTSGQMTDTINVPVYNGSTVPVLTTVGNRVGSNYLWMVDKGTVTYQSFVGYDVDTGTFTIGAYFPASFQFSSSTWMGSYIDTDGKFYGLIRGCSATCTMFYYRLDNYNQTGSVVSPVLLWQVAGQSPPAWRGLAVDSTTSPKSYYTLISGVIRLIDPATGAVLSALPNSPTTNVQSAYSFDFLSAPFTHLYYFTAQPTYQNAMVELRFSNADAQGFETTFPGALLPINMIYYASALPSFTTSPLTTSPVSFFK